MRKVSLPNLKEGERRGRTGRSEEKRKKSAVLILILAEGKEEAQNYSSLY